MAGAKSGGDKEKRQKPVKKDRSTDENVEVIQTQLAATRATLEEVRGTVESLRKENDRLTSNTRKSEKDTIEVIKYLRREGEKKDQALNELRRDLKDREITFLERRMH